MSSTFLNEIVYAMGVLLCDQLSKRETHSVMQACFRLLKLTAYALRPIEVLLRFVKPLLSYVALWFLRDFCIIFLNLFIAI